jgi:hypothetical protein
VFNIGGSKSGSSSSSSSYGYSTSFSDSLSQAASKDRVAFEDVFAQLYGGATGAAGKAAELVPMFQGQAAELYTGGMKFLDSLEAESPIAARLSDTGTADEQIAALGADLGQFFREEVNPALTSRGVATGTLGGARQGVAQGRAVSSLAKEFQRGATAIRTSDVARRDSLAGMLADDGLARASTGLNALPGLFGLAEGGAMAGLTPYLALSQVLGGPTVLGESSDFAVGTSRALSEETSQSQSKSKSKSFSFGLGG